MNRRNLLKMTGTGLFAAATFTSLAAHALTPKQPEGPFYPIKDQLDTDSDLVRVGSSNQIAAGEVIIIEGILTNQHHQPVSGALVEIWQACETGKYDHPSDPNPAALDPHFQYWGRSVTDINGKYKFRTIIPGEYRADVDWIRPPHIHFKVSKKGYLELITQMYFSGNALNFEDKILRRLNQEQQQELIVELQNVPNEKLPVGLFNIQIEKI